MKLFYLNKPSTVGTEIREYVENERLTQIEELELKKKKNKKIEVPEKEDVLF